MGLIVFLLVIAVKIASLIFVYQFGSLDLKILALMVMSLNCEFVIYLAF